ncbi:DUF2339 domain-containing protein [Actinosynnema sp. NPDC047251]|uniref:Uncharacterized protein n=1 Tax=Saccharothrix espanaensis (strain ATCC 51144 / DSM 44229 / JCM 9112 / NBRC 15066 / NRRL 15764) TaxID=1179773 RepID=K0KG31_SACES|nr:DUF2339 domain-containing protein [Saccharothrix espanaensis]CCH35719.1 hypothetical protein BN6_85050 [Saccharothrix espanaensis DSM 44229]
MTGPDPLLKLAEELGHLGRRLEAVGVELRAVRTPTTTTPPEPAATPVPTPAPAAPAPTAPAPTPVMAAPQWAGATGSGYGQPAYPPPAWPHPMQHPTPQHPAPQQPMPQPLQPPFPQAGPAPWSGVPVAPRPPRTTLFDRLSKPGAGSRLLAWVGGAVTLLGVVMLLVLAVQRGYLGPVPRVVGGALLGAALIGIALRLHRTETARTGAFAVAATGFAVLYLDVVAATSIYDYLPEGAGLAAGLAVAAGGLLLAMRWDSVAFAVGVVGAGAVCAPVLTAGFTPLLVAFLLVLKMAASPVHLKRNWPALAVTAGVPPLVATVLALGRTEDQVVLSVIALAAAVVGVAAAVLTARVRPDDRTALGLAIGSPLPALLTTAVLDRTWAAGLAGVIAALMLALWLFGRKSLPAPFAAGVAGVGVFALFVTTTVALDASPRAAVVLGEALVLAVLATRLQSRGSLLGAALFGGVGLVLTTAHVVPLRLLLVQQAEQIGTGRLLTGLLTSVVLLVLAVVLAWAAARLGVLARHPAPWIGIGLVVLYAAAGVVMCGALSVSQSVTGFLFGHTVVTVSWTVAALVLLVRGIDVRSLRVAGLVLVGAAVAKLLLFDLSALDGIARVLAFIGAGLVLLTAGTRYAKLVATRRISANS